MTLPKTPIKSRASPTQIAERPTHETAEHADDYQSHEERLDQGSPIAFTTLVLHSARKPPTGLAAQDDPDRRAGRQHGVDVLKVRFELIGTASVVVV